MMLGKCEVRNFASYDHLEFDFTSPGLILLQGATGSGKSTFQDIACWGLFGITAKDGNADDIRAWDSEKEITSVYLSVDYITIYRSRGKSSQNDLFYVKNGEKIRGKDVYETQQLINQELKITPEIYLTGAYNSEFSPTANFFSSTSSERRAILAQIADLSFCTTVSEPLQASRKQIKKTITEVTIDASKLSGQLSEALRSYASSQDYAKNWDTKHAAKLTELNTLFKSFDKTKDSEVQALKTKSERFEADLALTVENLIKKIVVLEQQISNSNLVQCSHCGAVQNPEERIKLQKMEKELNLKEAECERLYREVNPYENLLNEKTSEVNKYEQTIEDHNNQVNPFIKQLEDQAIKIERLEVSEFELKERIDLATYHLNSSNQLNTLLSELKSLILTNSITQIQDTTNDYLTKYFDSELRVELTLPDTDNVQVTIHKDGYDAKYKQLSKGQRGLLKICFSISIMHLVSNRSGVHFDNLFFDEALDGLDNNLKIKAFRLFEELSLSHFSIFVIDHCEEFKTLFNKQYHVTIEGGNSLIQEVL